MKSTRFLIESRQRQNAAEIEVFNLLKAELPAEGQVV